jgi:hypothetical protein
VFFPLHNCYEHCRKCCSVSVRGSSKHRMDQPVCPQHGCRTGKVLLFSSREVWWEFSTWLMIRSRAHLEMSTFDATRTATATYRMTDFSQSKNGTRWLPLLEIGVTRALPPPSTSLATAAICTSWMALVSSLGLSSRTAISL